MSVNAHTHLYSGLVPFDMPPPAREPETFRQILEAVWWRLDRALDAATLRASARSYVAEAVRLGTTALIDHHESPEFIEGSLDVLAEACGEFGMPALLCYGATERNGGREEARRGLAECRRLVERGEVPGVRGAVGLHAPFTVSDDTLRDAGALAIELGTVVHLHVAESEDDGIDARARGYAGVIDRLVETEALPPGSILAHGVHLSREEVRTCAERGWWLVQNPRSNRGNRVGYPRHLGESEQVALGTDGYPSDMQSERAALIDEAREHGEDLGRVEARCAAGRALITARLGGAATTEPRTPDPERLEELRDQARTAAADLWRRMEAIDP